MTARLIAHDAEMYYVEMTPPFPKTLEVPGEMTRVFELQKIGNSGPLYFETTP